MNRRERNSLDRYITGNYGEEQFKGTETICLACGEPCQVITVDFGVGFTDGFGAPNNDVCLCDVSNCCEAETEERNED